MKCPTCQTENPQPKKFCRKCGSRLILLCPQCKTECLPDDEFCGECGHSLNAGAAPPSPSAYAPPPPISPTIKEISPGETLAKVQRYLPQGLAERILSQRDRIEGERKQVTVLFTDMAGYTSMAERLDPEEAYTLMD